MCCDVQDEDEMSVCFSSSFNVVRLPCPFDTVIQGRTKAPTGPGVAGDAKCVTEILEGGGQK